VEKAEFFTFFSFCGAISQIWSRPPHF